jgi:hypothetical protein
MVHGLDNVPQEDYIPGTADENHIFETQQKFMFTVLNEHLQTDMGKTLVRKYGTHDAQKISLTSRRTCLRRPLHDNVAVSSQGHHRR